MYFAAASLRTRRRLGHPLQSPLNTDHIKHHYILITQARYNDLLSTQQRLLSQTLVSGPIPSIAAAAVDLAACSWRGWGVGGGGSQHVITKLRYDREDRAGPAGRFFFNNFFWGVGGSGRVVCWERKRGVGGVRRQTPGP